MLFSYRKGACAVAAALTLMAGAAPTVADTQGNHYGQRDHTVMIVDGGYFPAITYAQVGDTIIFENETDGEHTVNGPEESWTSGPIGSLANYVLEIKEETPLTFSGIGNDGLEVAGEISYDDPPLAD